MSVSLRRKEANVCFAAGGVCNCAAARFSKKLEGDLFIGGGGEGWQRKRKDRIVFDIAKLLSCARYREMETAAIIDIDEASRRKWRQVDFVGPRAVQRPANMNLSSCRRNIVSKFIDVIKNRRREWRTLEGERKTFYDKSGRRDKRPMIAAHHRAYARGIISRATARISYPGVIFKLAAS